MRRDMISIAPLVSSFLSCPKDIETLIVKLFVESRPYSDVLKKLLVVQERDCLDNKEYDEIVKAYSISKLMDEGYISISPKISRREHEEIKSYIVITFDDFSPNAIDPTFRDCTVYFDIVCYNDSWDLTNYRVRPLMIAGYIDGILNSISNDNRISWQNRGNNSNIKLSGMGEYAFLGCNLVVLN